MHVLGTGVPRRLGVAPSASSPKAVQALGCSLTPGLQISFGRVTCMAQAASVPGLWTLGFLLLCGVCVWVRVVFGLGFRLGPATRCRGEGVCLCLCARSACIRPLLAGLCGVGLCAWARVSALPRHSWLGCWGSLCACVCTPLVPRHSWLGCAVWVCVLGLGFRLRPATPGWGVGVLYVLVCALWLYPATPGWGVRCGCVCLGSGCGCAAPLLAGVSGCACWCARSACSPPLLAGVCGVGVCAWAQVSAPRHSWLGCAVSVCVLGLGFQRRPATPGWGVRVCVCLCVRCACTQPLLPGVCGVGVCAWARVSAAPRHFRLGCWGSVCACVRAPLVPRHSWLGL